MQLGCRRVQATHGQGRRGGGWPLGAITASVLHKGAGRGVREQKRARPELSTFCALVAGGTCFGSQHGQKQAQKRSQEDRQEGIPTVRCSERCSGGHAGRDRPGALMVGGAVLPPVWHSWQDEEEEGCARLAVCLRRNGTVPFPYTPPCTRLLPRTGPRVSENESATSFLPCATPTRWYIHL